VEGVLQSRAMLSCLKCGKENDDRAAYCQVCGAGLATSAASTVVVHQIYAGFWMRFVAMIIDAVIVSVASGLIATVTFGAGVVLSFVAPWLYEAFMLSSEWQATVGKRAMSIVVIGSDGGRISFARATGRHFAKWISICTLGIGFIMAAFTAKKQALHDMIAETFVTNR
jgi:uncharacterized RDD family membrane protein YckC